ncbi:MAG: hypothetical protein HYW15_00590 [Candidatus Giovannonibacteria bacterium]|nr:MAG: hypothetical protein HYW15_00590 [Candidatus Giovannonibacteria bacterium]
MKFFAKKIFTVFLSGALGASLILPGFAIAETDVQAGFDINDFQGGALDLLIKDSVPTDLVQERAGTEKDLVNSMFWVFAKTLVKHMTDQIVNLIRTGGQGGGPLFVTNWSDFLLDAADQASGVFLKELNLTRLCEPFAPQLRIIFNTGRRPLQDRFRCTVSAVAGNLQNFFNDFNSGGWATWIQLTEVQNNPYGAYLGLLEENEKRQTIAVEAKLNEALAARGFLNLEECEDVLIEADGGYDEPETKKRCQTVSPGAWLENRLAKATTADIEQLNLADSFNEILMASLQTLLQNLFFQQGGLRSANIGNIGIQQDLDAIKGNGIIVSHVDEAVLLTESVITTKESSLALVTDEIKTLQNLRACKQLKNEPIATIDNRISTATTTKLRVENNIVEQTIFKETLKDDKLAMQLAETVKEFQDAFTKTQSDVSKTASLSVAQFENAGIAADKKKAEDDLAACLAPPAVNP